MCCLLCSLCHFYACNAIKYKCLHAAPCCYLFVLPPPTQTHHESLIREVAGLLAPALDNETQKGRWRAQTSYWLQQQCDLHLTRPPVNPSINLHISSPAAWEEEYLPCHLFSAIFIFFYHFLPGYTLAPGKLLFISLMRLEKYHRPESL